jgi:thymidylate synthase
MMAEVIKVPTIRDGYREIVALVAEGEKAAPRGIPTREVRDLVIETTALDALPIGVGRQLNTKIGAVEALQLIGAFSDPDLVVRASPNFAAFFDTTEDDCGGKHKVFHGAYGNRIGDQMSDVVVKLRADSDSRQAVITLWDPHRDHWRNPPRRDYPCTVALTFGIRHGELDCSVLMRSNDVWLGLAYDAFQFTQLQWTIAHLLGIRAGLYTHHAVSMHMYDADLDKVKLLRTPNRSERFVTNDSPRGIQATAVLEARARARAFAKGQMMDHMTTSDLWYVALMKELNDAGR